MKELFNTLKYEALLMAVTKMEYASTVVDYPADMHLDPNAGIAPEWFYESFGGTSDAAEGNAINLYTSFGESYLDYNDLFIGIAMVEMMHKNKLRELIGALGGDVSSIAYTNTGLNRNIKAGATIERALQVSISGEIDTINLYNDIRTKVEAVSNSPTNNYVLALLNKLIADESLHIQKYQAALLEVQQQTVISNLSKHIK